MVKADYERNLERSLRVLKKLSANNDIQILEQLEQLLTHELFRVQNVLDRHVQVGDRILNARIDFVEASSSSDTMVDTLTGPKLALPATKILSKMSASQKLRAFEQE